jgi:hypothetical protein
MSKFAYDRQDQTIHQFSKDIRQHEGRSWKNATEIALESGRKIFNKPNVRLSFYDPNNVLNGSSSWSREQWNFYKQTGKNPITKK